MCPSLWPTNVSVPFKTYWDVCVCCQIVELARTIYIYINRVCIDTESLAGTTDFLSYIKGVRTVLAKLGYLVSSSTHSGMCECVYICFGV